MPRINHYQNIAEIDKEAKKDFIDRHSPFVHCEAKAKAGEKFSVQVKMGDEYTHPDDFDHHIQYLQLWNGETLLAQTNYQPGAMGNVKAHSSVTFEIIPTKKMKLVAMSYCTKHGLWESDPVEVEVEGA